MKKGGEGQGAPMIIRRPTPEVGPPKAHPAAGTRPTCCFSAARTGGAPPNHGSDGRGTARRNGRISAGTGGREKNPGTADEGGGDENGEEKGIDGEEGLKDVKRERKGGPKDGVREGRGE